MNAEDVALVQRCLDGDEGGLRALVQRFQGLVFAVCLRMLRQREDAEDVTQEVFLRVFRSLNRWDPTRPLKPWIVQIAVNRCRTHLAGRARRPVQAAPALLDSLAAPTGWAVRLVAEEVQHALQSLRPEHRRCFELFYRDQLSCEEIARRLNCPVGTVKTRLHRARRELAEALRRRGMTPDAFHEL